jgi:type II secretory pathway component PulJ
MRGGMEKMKRLIVAVVILAVIAVMAFRGCPRVRRNVGHGTRLVNGRLNRHCYDIFGA